MMDIKIAKQDETSEMFLKNLQLLPLWIRNIVMQIDDMELWEKVKITYNEEGYPLCKYCEDNRSFWINGRRPVQEAEQWGRSIKTGGIGGIFMFGTGFGYPIFELFQKKQPHTLVVLFEQNIYLFKAMLYYFDFEPVIMTRKLIFLIGDTEQFAGAFNQLFFSIAFINCSSPSYAFTNIANRNFKAHYIKIHQYIFSQLALYIFYIGNDHSDNLTGLLNLLANARFIVENPSISCLTDKYQGVPAFIIANGPSLDKNIHELKRIQEKGLIISTESAIVPLLRNKIKPDILTIIERTKYTYLYHFENVEYPADMALLCLGLVDKQVFPAFPGQIIPIFRNREAINQWINKFLGDGSALDAGSNVSHLAFEIAVLLGADPIVFVGQDYAYGPKGVTHSKDAIYLEDKGKLAREILESLSVIYIESNEGTMIPSNQIWKDFKVGLEQKLASHPDKTIINATEGGAKINGTVCEPLFSVIDKYCNKPIPGYVYEQIAENKAKISVSQRKEGLKEFIDDIKTHIELFRSLSQISLKGKLECREMICLSEEKDAEKHYSALEEAYRKNIETYQFFIADDLPRCFSQQVIFAYYYFMNRLGLIDTPEKMTEIFKIQHDFFLNLNVVCQSVSVHLENAIGLLEDTLANLENVQIRSDPVESD